MLSRTLRRALLDSGHHLPPTFLLPWTAHLSTVANPADVAPPPSMPIQSNPLISTSQPSTAESKIEHTPMTYQKASPLNLSDTVRQLLPALRAQRQIYISIHIHGKAYLLTQGDTLRLPFHMKDVEPGDILRLNRALHLGSRDYTLKAGAAPPRLKSGYTGLNPSAEGKGSDASIHEAVAPHFVPHIAKGKFAYLDERLFVCRASVMGVESEPLRIKEKTKRRQRHVKHVQSKHRYTILKIKELRINSLEQIESGDVD